MDKYTKPREVVQPKDHEPDQIEQMANITDLAQPSLSDIMAAIQDIRGTIEIKIDSIATEMNLLRADFQKTNDKVTEHKSAIESLQTENRALRKQVIELHRNTKIHKTKLDDLEGRSRQNNIRITGIPEKAEGAAVDLFVEDLILKGLRPHGLSDYFSVE